MECARGIIIPLTQRGINCKFLDLKGINKIFIYSVAHCIIVKKFTSTNSLKCLMLHFIFIIVISKIKTSNLHETFLNFFFFKYNKKTPLLLRRSGKI